MLVNIFPHQNSHKNKTLFAPLPVLLLLDKNITTTWAQRRPKLSGLKSSTGFKSQHKSL